MSLLSDLYGLSRFALGLRAFVRSPLTLDESRAIVRRGMERREESFVEKVKVGVFGNPKSPYLKLFRRAGCELDDVAQLTRTEGVEGALERLRDAGIYVTVEEFKGREPIRRGSDTFAVRDTDFDNTWITAHFRSTSGGTTGPPSRIVTDLEHVAQTAPHHHLWFAEHGWLNRPLALWTPGHTGAANRHLLCARYGQHPVRWFCTTRPSSAKDRLAAACVHTLVRYAAQIPRGELVPVSEAATIAQYLVGLQQQGQQPCLITAPSQAIRVCQAACEAARTLENVTFLLGAEPLTRTRLRTIEASGAKAVPTYGFSEGGNVGSQCRTAPAADDIHVSLDAYAVTQRPRRVADDVSVDALLLTALRPACPKVLLNAEIGDYAVMTSP